jgi:methylene-fatty-acyl-phospholipid synthase
MTLGAFAVAAVLLAVERACYVTIARAPGAFRAWCARPPLARLGGPVAVVERLFYLFKLLQAVVVVGWCFLAGDGSLWPTARDPWVLGAAGAAILAGQVLTTAVFWRLGRVGVFYGDRFGHEVARCEAFPFSLLAHPQYVGAVLTIWGVFAIARFPGDDWFLIPALETAYYAVGTWLEGRGAATP